MQEAAPHSVLYEGLKDFQPIMAAIIALIAAMIAYFSATASVRYQKKQAEKSAREAKLGLCLRVKYEAELTSKISGYIQQKDGLESLRQLYGDGPPDRREHHASMVRFTISQLGDLSAIDEAWKSLHSFGPEPASAISLLRTRLRGVPAALNAEMYAGRINENELAAIETFFSNLHLTADQVAKEMTALTAQPRK
jgi:hypothetical protein